MSIKNYIIQKIDELSSVLKGIEISVRYAYETSTDFHVIEVSPEKIRRGNETYMQWEESVWKEFAEQFPEVDLVISEPDELNDMSNLQYTYTSLNNIPFKTDKVESITQFNSKFDLNVAHCNYLIAA